MNMLEEDWQLFLSGNDLSLCDKSINIPKCPKSSELRISTKVVISNLNITNVDIYKHFWDLPIIPFWKQEEGIIKKQLKYTCNTKAEYEFLQSKLSKEPYANYVNIKHYEKEIVNNKDEENETQVEFKDVSKITVGISNKELMNSRIKKRGAFYNSYSLVLRINEGGTFKEVNLKIFNTGKISYPGMLTQNQMDCSLKIMINVLEKLLKTKIYQIRDTIQTVLINSNFRCGYYLNRDELYKILKYDYKIHASYDQCSYPGIQCKYFDNVINKQNNGKCICKIQCNRKGNGDKEGSCSDVSFMIFRTGSVLIVGKCEEPLLRTIYNFVKNVLYDNYEKIFTGMNEIEKTGLKKENKKKYFYVTK